MSAIINDVGHVGFMSISFHDTAPGMVQPQLRVRWFVKRSHWKIQREIKKKCLDPAACKSTLNWIFSWTEKVWAGNGVFLASSIFILFFYFSFLLHFAGPSLSADHFKIQCNLNFQFSWVEFSSIRFVSIRFVSIRVAHNWIIYGRARPKLSLIKFSQRSGSWSINNIVFSF